MGWFGGSMWCCDGMRLVVGTFWVEGTGGTLEPNGVVCSHGLRS